MEDETNDIENLIGNVLAGEATAEEKIQLENWIGKSADNKAYFEQLQLIFEKASSKNVQLEVDTDAAWQNVKSKLREPKAKQVDIWRTVKIAAGIIWLVFLAYMFYQTKNKTPQAFAISTDKQTIQDTLPDGSTTFLNRKSKLTYAYDAKRNIRKVKLKGEAFFVVKHETKPFIIEAGDVLIKDIGTEFNVKAYPETSTIEVSVASGEVQFYTEKNPGLFLKAGELGVYDKSIKEFSKIMKLDTNVLAYKTKVLTFSDSDLQSVVTSLNAVYDAKISIANEAIRKCKLTVNFNNDRLETIVDVIAETLHLTVTKTGDKIILSGSGCSN